jgi:HD-GYP domain-containing protein (c-di-GMP phosphodiesterase class II)
MEFRADRLTRGDVIGYIRIPSGARDHKWDQLVEEWGPSNPMIKLGIVLCKDCGLRSDFIGHRHDRPEGMSEEEALEMLEDYRRNWHECPRQRPESLQYQMAELHRSEAELKRAQDEVRKAEERFHSLYSSMSEAACLHEIIYDESGEPVDYVILDVNPSYESILDMKREVAVGSKASELYGFGEPPYLDIYAQVAATGEPTSFETYSPLVDKHFRISVFSPGKGKFATVFSDVSERVRGERELRDPLQMLRKALGGTITTLALIVEKRDPYTTGHQQRSTNLARAIATEMGLAKKQIEGIRVAGGIHDLGKLFVPAEILTKPGRLTEAEFELIETHPQVAYDILKSVDFPWPVAEIVLQHHERWNGSGYPQGLSGKDILPEARILAVADVVEAMASNRSYRPAKGVDKALDEIPQDRGVLYDPQVVDACLALFTEKGFEL